MSRRCSSPASTSRIWRYLGKAAINDTVSGAAVFGNSTAKDGWGINLGATAPAFGGKFYAAVGYMDADHSDDTAGKLKRYTVSLGYDYSLSKRPSSTPRWLHARQV